MIAATRAVLDAGVLISAEARSKAAWSLEKRGRGGRVLIVSTPVLAQVWRSGPRQAVLARFLKGCVIQSPSERIAKRAGELLGRTGTSDAVDALVVATALEQEAAMILTSDPVDIETLVAASEAAFPPLIQKV
ncbi:type II toxin-antitoxin system VapC family toxin [Actinoallomurus rhizosphaericola]|uniref:type II toxin-antitoxin system VapC family toxin n=1 Tax=Actinoallomurus rhizosphaericola TaxID=2952536 RepID=UPI00209022A0|nr:PIN domain-containing protein [Actinoallomurus rhizosphaericola]MCO5993878.1 PIN domain-containing protein [Actinoallomurus rhizosphaericola]